MINLFARRGIDGLIIAACCHQRAKALGAGIHVTYVGDNADSELLDLMANTELAVTVDARLPKERQIILFGTSLSSSRRRTLEHFLLMHPDVKLNVEMVIPIPKRWLFLLRVFAFFIRPFLGADGSVLLMADYVIGKITPV